MYKSNLNSLNKYLDKMNRNELKLEDILDDDEFTNEIKTSQDSRFIPL